jgi:uncharacterized protein (TIGR02996 family)
MVAIITFAVLLATVLGLVVYSFVHKPKPGEVYVDVMVGGDASGGFGSPAVSPGGDAFPVPPEPAHEPIITAALVDAVPAAVWRTTLSADADEQQFLVTLRSRPSDEEVRMVYADWLEERGRSADASFVRGVEKYPETQTLVSTSALDWRAITCRERAECSEHDCPRNWDAFAPSSTDERLRQCNPCHKTVRYCADRAEQRACAARGERTVVDLGGLLPAKPVEPS